MRFVSVGECMIEMAEVSPGTYKLGFAGDTLNTAWYVRGLLGREHEVDYVTALGKDIYSDRIAAYLGENGIGINCIRRFGQRRPGLYLIHHADGDRHFTYWRGQSAAKRIAEDPAFLRAALAEADCIYFSGITLAILSKTARQNLLAAIAERRLSGTRVIFDPNYRPSLWRSAKFARRVISDAAALSDMVMPTFADDRELFGDISPEATASRYLALGVTQVVVKNGRGDALLAEGDLRHSVSPDEGVEVIDPTGAGDSFNGAYIASLLRNDSPLSALRHAHSTAATVIGHKGALMDMDSIAALGC